MNRETNMHNRSNQYQEILAGDHRTCLVQHNPAGIDDVTGGAFDYILCGGDTSSAPAGEGQRTVPRPG